MFAHRAGWLIGFLLTSLAATALLGEEPAGKAPVPDAAAQAEAAKLVQEVYGHDVAAAKTSAQKAALAAKILQMARENEKDLPARFVLLRLSKEIAVQAADCRTAFAAVDELAKSFVIDSPDLKFEALRKVAFAATNADQHESLADLAAEFLERAIAGDNFTIAKSVCDLGIGEAKKAKDDQLVRRLSERKAEIEGIAHASVAVKSAKAVLEATPTDPEANLIVGKYDCFALGDWERGLPRLALGSDASLKSLGEAEAKSPASPEDQATLAEMWWVAAETREAGQKKPMQARSRDWYRKALPGLTGLAKDKALRRLRTHPEELPVFLTDLPIEELRAAPGPAKAFKGKLSPHSLFAHPPTGNSSSHMAFQLDRRFKTLRGDVGICGINQVAVTPLVFRIVGDGKTLWQSKPLQASEVSVEFRVSVNRIKKLELFVDCPGSYDFAWAEWLEPILER